MMGESSDGEDKGRRRCRRALVQDLPRLLCSAPLAALLWLWSHSFVLVSRSLSLAPSLSLSVREFRSLARFQRAFAASL